MKRNSEQEHSTPENATPEAGATAENSSASNTTIFRQRMIEFNGWDIEEIAQELNCPVRAVQRIIERLQRDFLHGTAAVGCHNRHFVIFNEAEFSALQQEIKTKDVNRLKTKKTSSIPPATAPGKNEFFLPDLIRAAKQKEIIKAKRFG